MKKEKKILKLNNNEEITILGTNKNGISIKNINNILNVENLENISIKDNYYIKDVNFTELNSFVIVKLLENNDMNKNDSELLMKLLENHYNYLCGKSYSSDDIEEMYFQCITHYNN